MDYEMVSGIEVHVQVRTATKLFCGCEVRFGAPPNSLVCPVCLGLPGALPVPNRKAFELAVRAALALHCEVVPFTKFDRKNYFYPDLPKNYQISQYDIPFSREGHLDIDLDGGGTKRIGIERAHLEEDAGKLMHVGGAGESWVDLNRCGVPLIEIVSKPDLRSPEEAVAYLAALKTLLQYADVSDCDMEKGELRCDLNISLRPKGSKDYGTRVEIKNLNSFRFAAKALTVEMKRQAGVLNSGGRVAQETRLYDADRGETKVMRSKEEAHDYRYFPEPDLPPIRISREWLDGVAQTLPEPPRDRKARFLKDYHLTEAQAETLVMQRGLGTFFERCVEEKIAPAAAANWVINDMIRVLRDQGKELEQTSLTPPALAELVRMVEQKTVTGASAKDLLVQMVRTGKDSRTLVQEQGLGQVNDAGAIESVADAVIAENVKAVQDFRSGKQATLQFLIGQVMKKTRGRASPDVARDILLKKLQ